jgi:hypothetical protein
MKKGGEDRRVYHERVRSRIDSKDGSDQDQDDDDEDDEGSPGGASEYARTARMVCGNRHEAEGFGDGDVGDQWVRAGVLARSFAAVALESQQEAEEANREERHIGKNSVGPRRELVLHECREGKSESKMLKAQALNRIVEQPGGRTGPTQYGVRTQEGSCWKSRVDSDQPQDSDPGRAQGRASVSRVNDCSTVQGKKRVAGGQH